MLRIYLVLRFLSPVLFYALRVLDIGLKLGFVAFLLAWRSYYINHAFSELDVAFVLCIIFFSALSIWRTLGTDWMQEFFTRYILPSLDKKKIAIGKSIRHVLFWFAVDLVLGTSLHSVNDITPINYRLRPLLPEWMHQKKSEE